MVRRAIPAWPAARPGLPAATTRMPKVAPNDSTNPRIQQHDRPTRDSEGRGDREHVERRAAMVENAREEVQERGADRTLHRRRRHDNFAVDEEQNDRRSRRGPGRDSHLAERGHDEDRENRDVPARDRYHVIRPGILESAGIGIWKTCAVADQHGNRDRRRFRAPPADGVAKPVANPRPYFRSPLSCERPVGHDLDHRSALHGADQDDAPPRQRTSIVANSWIEVRRWRSEQCRDPYSAARPPRHEPRRSERAADRQADAARPRRRYPSVRGVHADALHIDDDGRRRTRERCILAQHSVDQNRHGWILRSTRLEPLKKRWMVGAETPTSRPVRAPPAGSLSRWRRQHRGSTRPRTRRLRSRAPARPLTRYRLKGPWPCHPR